MGSWRGIDGRVSEKLTRKEPRVNWESGLEEEAMLVSQQDETTREKLQYWRDWFRWHFERWGTAEVGDER